MIVKIVSTNRLHGWALRAAAEFALDDRVMQRPLAGVVCRLDAIDIDEGPQPVSVFVQRLDNGHGGPGRLC
jgi:hypothetical protein